MLFKRTLFLITFICTFSFSIQAGNCLDSSKQFPALKTIAGEALEVATFYHRKQIRKFDKKPYIVHPIRVANTLIDLDLDPAIIRAALLHDTLEDTLLTGQEIRQRFGERVYRLVGEVTAEEDKLAEMGKSDYWSQKVKEMSLDALYIKLADRLDNTSDFSPENLNFIEKYLPQSYDLIYSILERKDLNHTHHYLIMKVLDNLIDGDKMLMDSFN